MLHVLIALAVQVAVIVALLHWLTNPLRAAKSTERPARDLVIPPPPYTDAEAAAITAAIVAMSIASSSHV